MRAAFLVLLHVLVRTGLELVLRTAPGHDGVLRYASVVVLVLVARLWAGLDVVREDREDVQRDDLAARRLKAALLAGPLAGPLAGLLGWAVEGLFVDASGSEELLVELTGGAAFTALLVLLPAALGLFVGGRVRPADPEPEPVVGTAREARRARLQAREH